VQGYLSKSLLHFTKDMVHFILRTAISLAVVHLVGLWGPHIVCIANLLLSDWIHIDPGQRDSTRWTTVKEIRSTYLYVQWVSGNSENYLVHMYIVASGVFEIT
jgi:hypothetical protein